MTKGGGKNGKLVQALHGTVAEVQALLERNQVLIQEIGQNQAARDEDALHRNVALIRELNTNINRVTRLYSDFSDFLLRSLHGAVAAKKKK